MDGATEVNDPLQPHYQTLSTPNQNTLRQVLLHELCHPVLLVATVIVIVINIGFLYRDLDRAFSSACLNVSVPHCDGVPGRKLCANMHAFIALVTFVKP